MANDRVSSELHKEYRSIGTIRSWLWRLHPKPFLGVVFVALSSAFIMQCAILIFVDFPRVKFARVIEGEQAISAIRLDIIEQILNDRPISFERLVINYGNKANAHGGILYEEWYSFWRFWEHDHVPAIRLTLLDMVIHPMDQCLRPPGRRFEVPTKAYVAAISSCIQKLGLDTVLSLPGTNEAVDQSVTELKTRGSGVVELKLARTLSALSTVRERLAVLVDQAENGLHVAGERNVLQDALRLAEGYVNIRAAAANPNIDSRAIDAAAAVRVDAHRAQLEEWLNYLGEKEQMKGGNDTIELTNAVKHRVANVVIFTLSVLSITLLTSIGCTEDIFQTLSDMVR